MPKSKVKIKTKENLAVPGKPMTQQKFKETIEKAENGEFYTPQEFKERFDQWRKKIKK